MPKVTQQFVATDEPSSRDYPFSDYEEFASANEVDKRPTNKIILQNQKSTPWCTCFALTVIVNANNINEDKKLWLSRTQIDSLTLRNKFCAERWDYSSGTSIQTMALWEKKQGLIEGFVSISNTQELDVIERQVDSALAMGKFIYTGSLRWDWAAIKKTWIYTERTDGITNWHSWDIVIERKEWDYYMCPNSYWPTRWILGWYFKLHRNDLKKIYSKLVILDKDDSHLFSRFEEIQKVKQAVALLRTVYWVTTLDWVKSYLEKIKLWENFSTLYWIII